MTLSECSGLQIFFKNSLSLSEDEVVDDPEDEDTCEEEDGSLVGMDEDDLAIRPRLEEFLLLEIDCWGTGSDLKIGSRDFEAWYSLESRKFQSSSSTPISSSLSDFAAD
jgi:hypothetical protein